MKSVGIDCGPALRGVEVVYMGSAQVLVKLSIPDCIKESQDQFFVHPTLLDSALQGMMSLRAGSHETVIPFAVEEVEIMAAFSSGMWSWVRPCEGNLINDKISKLDVDVFDEQGKICLKLKGITLRAV